MLLIPVGVTLIGGLCLFLGATLFADPGTREGWQAAKADKRNERTGLRMARLLERSIGDPMYRTSQQWEDEANRLVRDWYGD